MAAASSAWLESEGATTSHQAYLPGRVEWTRQGILRHEAMGREAHATCQWTSPPQQARYLLMPATSRAVTIGTSPTRVAEAKPAYVRSWMTLAVPQSAARTVFFGIGQPTVSLSTGTALHAGEMLAIENSSAHAQPARQELWAVVGFGTQEVIIAEGT